MFYSKSFGAFFIRMYDEDNNHVGTISINTTTDQVIEVLKVNEVL